MGKRSKVIEGEFVVVGEAPVWRAPRWFEWTVGFVVSFRPLGQLVAVTLILIGISAILTDGATTREIHRWLWGW